MKEPMEECSSSIDNPSKRPKYESSPNDFPNLPLNVSSHFHVLTLDSLPEDVILMILSYVPLKDLMNICSVCLHLKNLVKDNQHLFANADCSNLWPSSVNFRLVERASFYGNFDAKIKLAVCYLYGEKISKLLHDHEKQAKWAAELLISAEGAFEFRYPFTWILYRPPWGFEEKSNKAKVFSAIKDIVQSSDHSKNRAIFYSIGQCMTLQENPSALTEALEWFQKGSDYGCPYASVINLKNSSCNDANSRRKITKELHSLVISHPLCKEAQYSICKSFIAEDDFIFPMKVRTENVARYFQSSKSASLRDVWRINSYLSSQMRYILLDWIAEVSSIKMFSSSVFHTAVRIVDKFLGSHQCPRANLQLTGITALLLTSRFLSKDVLTIREAAWLTDNTYSYRQVVEVLGEIVATLKGDIIMATSLDYLNLILEIQKPSDQIIHLSHYFCDLSVFHAALLERSHSSIASACVILARIFNDSVLHWNETCSRFTGFNISMLKEIVLELYDHCFLSNRLEDMNFQPLTAIKEKYQDKTFLKVSMLPVPERKDVCDILQINKKIDVNVKMTNWNRSTAHRNRNPETSLWDQFKTIEQDDYSILSGYDGDDESDNATNIDCSDGNLQVKEKVNLLWTPDSSQCCLTSAKLPSLELSNNSFACDTDASSRGEHSTSSASYYSTPSQKTYPSTKKLSCSFDDLKNCSIRIARSPDSSFLNEPQRKIRCKEIYNRSHQCNSSNASLNDESDRQYYEASQEVDPRLPKIAGMCNQDM